MHLYSFEDGNRKAVFTFVIAISLVLSFAINTLVSKYLSGFTLGWMVSFLLYLSPALFMYLILKLFSRILISASGIPYVAGRYTGILNSNYSKEQDTSVILEITQDLLCMDIKLSVPDSSESHSCMSMLEKNGSEYALTYSYENHAKYSENQLTAHSGLCELKFNGDSVEGKYFTSPERNSFGNLKLKKV